MGMAFTTGADAILIESALRLSRRICALASEAESGIFLRAEVSTVRLAEESTILFFTGAGLTSRGVSVCTRLDSGRWVSRIVVSATSWQKQPAVINRIKDIRKIFFKCWFVAKILNPGH